MDESVLGLRIGAFTEKSSPQIALLSLKSLDLFWVQEGKLAKISSYPLPQNFEPIRLSRYDFHGDGINELIITGFQKGRVQTLFLAAGGGKWQHLQTVAYHVNPIRLAGTEKLVGQRQFGQEDFSGTPFVIEGLPPALKEGNPLNLKKGLWTKQVPLYSLSGFDLNVSKPGYLLTDQTGYLIVAEEGERGLSKVWGSGEAYGGSVYHLDLEIRNILNELEKSHFDIPVRFVYDGDGRAQDMRGAAPVKRAVCDVRDETFWHPPCVYEDPNSLPQLQGEAALGLVYAIKNADYLKNVAGAVPAVKNSQMVLLKWNGHSLQEVWNSPRLDGGISDFDLMNWDNDRAPEIIAVNVLRGRGYWETQKGFKSQVIVLDPKVE